MKHWLAAGLWLFSARFALAGSLAGSWSFEGDGARIEDRSGNGLDGAAANCARAAGRVGQGLKLDGSGGMTVPNSPTLRGPRGFTLQCWIKSDVGPGPAMNIMLKPGEFQLRVDPAKAGGTISFFVWCEGRGWEPRARGPRLQPGKWYGIAASWDRRTVRLRVNRFLQSAKKAGVCPHGSAPLHVGGPAGGLAGFRGIIDEVKVLAVPSGTLTMAREAYGMGGPRPKKPRRDARFEFRAGLQGWTGEWGAKVSVRNGVMCATLPDEEAIIKVGGLDVGAEDNPVCSVRVAASSGKRGVCIFAGDRMCKEVPFRLIADGAMRSYVLRCVRQPPWAGRIHSIGLYVEEARDTELRTESTRLNSTAHAAPDVRILSLAPARRINALRKPVEVFCWLENLGGDAANVTATLTATQGISVRGEAVKKVAHLGFDKRKTLTWRIVANSPTRGDVRVVVTCAGARCGSMRRPIRFAAAPEAESIALARSRAWRQAGYPRSMDFRHLFPGAEPFFEHNTALLVDMCDDKIAAAQEFKRRYPDQLVLMQVNDEPNGIWGSWHCVPKEYAIKEKLKFDPVVFPMPKFRGYWLLGPGAVLSADVSANAEFGECRVPETKWFVSRRYGHEFPRDVLIYRRVAGMADWTYSEYASVVAVDKAKKIIKLRRWPKEAVGEWHAFRAGEAYVAPSVGSIYGLGKRKEPIRTWVPNLTKFCPRDPATGQDAATWWAKHFARLWHTRIAAQEPHPDGYEFDGLNEGAVGDCNNDGVVDGCEIGGINYWRLGIYDFFRKLRQGVKDFKGMGDALILADASSAWSPRDLSLLNGSENEEFPSFSGPQFFPAAMDLYLLWCAYASPPGCSYLQGRFMCDTYCENDWRHMKARGKFHDDSLARLSIASACMGAGIYTYRAGSPRDHGAILDQAEILEYPWDEYCAGREGVYNWLGLPLGAPVRITEHLGPHMMPKARSVKGWEVSTAAARIRAEGPRTVNAGTQEAIEVNVVSINDFGQPRARRYQAGGRCVLLSPTTSQPVSPDREYCVSFRISADPGYDRREGARYAGVRRVVGLRLDVGGISGTAQWILVGKRGRRVAITLRPNAKGQGRVVFLVGAALGCVRVGDLRVQEGCAEVFARRFEHGLVLANGSAVSPYTFDIAELGGGRKYRRFLGAQAPLVNDGKPVRRTLTLPPCDGILLRGE